MKMNWKALGAGLAALALSGCGASHKNTIGSQTPVLSIPEKRPSWLGRGSYEESGRLYYRGAVTGRADMALGLREARAEGEKSLAEEVRQKIRTEFGSAVKGENFDGELGRHVFDIVAKVSENVQITGAQFSEQYAQKMEERTPYGVRYVWDCFALMSLSREDYMEARRQALDGAVVKARQERNIKAEEALHETFRKLTEEKPAFAVTLSSAAASIPAAAAGVSR